jgi:hypothetical protein
VLFARRLSAAADETATGVVTITLTDGATLVGAIVADDEIAVTLRTSSGVELKLPKQAIASRETPRAASELGARRYQMKSIALGLVLTFALTPVLAAQEVSARYGHLLARDGHEGRSEGWYGMPGWQASVASDTRALRFVVDAGGYYGPYGGYGLHRLHTLMIGPRLASREAHKVTVFGQVLVGAAFAEGAALTLCPGVGVDVPASEALAVRLQVDLPLIVSYGAPGTLQLSAGIAVRLGRR